MKTNRRSFIKTSAVSLAGLGAISVLPSTVWGANVPPSDKINVALIGCKSMGFGDLKQALSFPEVNCVALCDIDENSLIQEQPKY
jgi:hypothetical protein